MKRLMLFALFFTACGAPASDAKSSEDSIPTIEPQLIVSFDEQSPSKLPRNFIGLNTAELADSVEYTDTRYQSSLKQIGPGWLRFAAGTADDAYDWQSADTPDAWIAQLTNAAGVHSDLESNLPFVRAKAVPNSLGNFRTLLGNVGANAVVVVNGFTDTAASAASLAATIASFSPAITVNAYELSNEAYLSTFGSVPSPPSWTDANGYLGKMQPFAEAIHKKDASAHVTIFATYGASSGADFLNWNDEIRQYQMTSGKPFWNGISLHYYRAVIGSNATSFDIVERILNSSLRDDADSFIPAIDAQLTPPGMPPPQYTISEYNIVDGPNAPVKAKGTAYAGLFLAEYALRMSTVPNVRSVGPHVAYSERDPESAMIGATTGHDADVQRAYDRQTTIDTTTLDYGFYLTAPGIAMAIVSDSLAGVDQRLTTTISGAGGQPVPQVPTRTSDATIPAVFATAYCSSSSGIHSIAITNKASVPLNVELANGEVPLSSSTALDVVEMDTPTADARNGANSSPVTLHQYSMRGAVVQIPAWSVVSVRF
jgi:hypothetical protein